jgi:hypothetical protein
MMESAVGIHADRVRAILTYLEHLEFAKYDHDREFVWVIEMARWQLGLTEPLKHGDRRIMNANSWYRSLPKNQFLGAFYDRYATDLSLHDRREPCESVAPAPVVTTALAKRSAALDGRAVVLDRFERWWRHYPKKVGKKAALAEWLKITPAPDEAFIERAIALLAQQRTSPEWIKEGGQYIPDPERYIRKGRYLDEPRTIPHLTEAEAATATNLLNWVSQP